MRPRAWRRRGDEGHVVAMRLRVEPEARLSVCFGCAVVLHTNVSRETFVRRCFAIRLSRAAPRSSPALRCPPRFARVRTGRADARREDDRDGGASVVRGARARRCARVGSARWRGARSTMASLCVPANRPLAAAARRRGGATVRLVRPPSFLLVVPFPARIDPVAVIGRIPSLPATPFSSPRASLGLVALGGASAACRRRAPSPAAPSARFALCLGWPLPAGHWSHARCSPPRGFDRGARMFHVKHWRGFDHWAATEESPAGKTPIFGKKSRFCSTIRRSASVL